MSFNPIRKCPKCSSLNYTQTGLLECCGDCGFEYMSGVKKDNLSTMNISEHFDEKKDPEDYKKERIKREKAIHFITYIFLSIFFLVFAFSSLWGMWALCIFILDPAFPSSTSGIRFHNILAALTAIILGAIFGVLSGACFCISIEDKDKEEEEF